MKRKKTQNALSAGMSNFISDSQIRAIKVSYYNPLNAQSLGGEGMILASWLLKGSQIIVLEITLFFLRNIFF